MTTSNKHKETPTSAKEDDIDLMKIVQARANGYAHCIEEKVHVNNNISNNNSNNNSSSNNKAKTMNDNDNVLKNVSKTWIGIGSSNDKEGQHPSKVEQQEELNSNSGNEVLKQKSQNVHGVVPPVAPLSRQTPVNLNTSQPGAYANTPGSHTAERRHNLPFSVLATNRSSDTVVNNNNNNNSAAAVDGQPPCPEVCPSTPQLASEQESGHVMSLARPVEHDVVLDLGAEEVDQAEMEQRKSKRKAKERKELLVVMMACVVVVVIVVATLLVVTREKNSDNDSTDVIAFPSPLPSPLAMETESPSLAPANVITELLPDYTLESIKNGTTPQWKALEWLMDHPELRVMPGWRKTQLFALGTFYYAMDGDNWPRHIKENWLLYDKNECFWFSGLFGYFSDGGSYELDENAVGYTPFETEGIGYPCNDDYRFQTLIMQRLGINESKPFIPRELSLLTSLFTLSLQKNQINASLADFVPSEVFQMVNITFFDLYLNSLTGTIPTGFGQMSNVLQFELGDNSLTGNIPSELGLMTSMTELHLYSNSLSGLVPSEVGLLSNMVEVTMHQSILTGPLPTEIGYMTNTVRWHLGPSQLSGTIPSQVELLTSLVDFSLSENSFSGNLPSEIAWMTSLQVLRLANNSLTGTIPSELSRLAVDGSLGLLSLEENAITGQIPEGLCVLGQSLLTFDCSSDLCGCCWCPCPGDDINSTECSTDLSSNPLFGEWPGDFPPLNASNTVTVNIHTDDWNEETSWTWSVLGGSDTWQTLDSQKPANASSLFSYPKEVESGALYRLSLFDSYGDGNCCGWGFGWFSVTNSTPSPEHVNGTVIWSAVGDVLDGGNGVLQQIEEGTALDVFLWIDDNGSAQQVERVAGQGYVLAQEGGVVTIVANSSAVGRVANLSIVP